MYHEKSGNPGRKLYSGISKKAIKIRSRSVKTPKSPFIFFTIQNNLSWWRGALQKNRGFKALARVYGV
jgi:hypothetical protein